MDTIASQITGVSIVYWNICSCVDQRKHQSSASLACEGNSPVTAEFPAQRASKVENVFIWWRHHDIPTEGPQTTKYRSVSTLCVLHFVHKKLDVHNGHFDTLTLYTYLRLWKWFFCGNDSESVIFKLICRFDILSSSCEITLKRMPQKPFDCKSTMVHVMAWWD